MTPRKKAEGQTTIKMERVARQALDKGNVMHEAGGDHRGIVINRLASRDDDDDDSPEISLEFRVFLTNVVTEVHTRESRELKFWFKPGVTKNDQRHSAQEFFKELVSPSDFPRDYVGFIKKIMKLMQMKYINMRKVEIEMRQLENITEPPRRPNPWLSLTLGQDSEVPDGFSSVMEGTINFNPDNMPHLRREVSLDDSTLEAKMELTQEKVLEIIESAYPNPVSLTELSR
ncbi:hypothetical protein HPB50_021073 [Hyalomma asiaticum]|uniref:Uncharacterized protein n=1 Tax=Hyalomma asiaticum TaxID=266040 RepID=A0ACB7SAK8_HYAAI|nr:hypothetical protein HPB50_021073 [Hyalomma asiaticum]